MRKILVVERIDIEARMIADSLGLTEIACDVPRLVGIVKSYPSVVIESATNPGIILGVFNANMITGEEIEVLQDLPSPPEVLSRDLVAELDQVKADIQTIKAKVVIT